MRTSWKLASASGKLPAEVLKAGQEVGALDEEFRQKRAARRPGIDTVPGPFRTYTKDFAAYCPEDDGELLQMLRQIRRILEEETLDDFECIEEIIQVYVKAGYSVGYRHDFG
jgi:hypothetical protein